MGLRLKAETAKYKELTVEFLVDKQEISTWK